MTSRWVVREGADLTRALAELRHARGLTQESLAQDLAIDRTRLARLEQGMTTKLLNITVRALRRLGATIVVEFDSSETEHDG